MPRLHPNHVTSVRLSAQPLLGGSRTTRQHRGLATTHRSQGAEGKAAAGRHVPSTPGVPLACHRPPRSAAPPACLHHGLTGLTDNRITVSAPCWHRGHGSRRKGRQGALFALNGDGNEPDSALLGHNYAALHHYRLQCNMLHRLRGARHHNGLRQCSQCYAAARQRSPCSCDSRYP
jgi:hypothetical protein